VRSGQGGDTSKSHSQRAEGSASAASAATHSMDAGWASEFGEDGLGRLGPDEGLGVLVVLFDVAADGVLQVGDGFEHAAADAPAANDREEAFDGIQHSARSQRLG